MIVVLYVRSTVTQEAVDIQGQKHMPYPLAFCLSHDTRYLAMQETADVKTVSVVSGLPSACQSKGEDKVHPRTGRDVSALDGVGG